MHPKLMLIVAPALLAGFTFATSEKHLFDDSALAARETFDVDHILQILAARDANAEADAESDFDMALTELASLLHARGLPPRTGQLNSNNDNNHHLRVGNNDIRPPLLFSNAPNPSISDIATPGIRRPIARPNRTPSPLRPNIHTARSTPLAKRNSVANAQAPPQSPPVGATGGPTKRRYSVAENLARLHENFRNRQLGLTKNAIRIGKGNAP